MGPSNRPTKRRKIDTPNDPNTSITTSPLPSIIEESSEAPNLSTNHTPDIIPDTNSTAITGNLQIKHHTDHDPIREQTSLFDKDANYVPITQDSINDIDEPFEDI